MRYSDDCEWERRQIYVTFTSCRSVNTLILTVKVVWVYVIINISVYRILYHHEYRS